LDAVNNISKFVDGVEWFMVALHSSIEMEI
jgi:hypothetical protein